MAKKNDTVKAIVAPRRTVHLDGKSYGPGAEVELDADEAMDLQAGGFLVDPEAQALPAVGNGPEFTQTGGQGNGPNVTPA